MASTNTAIIKWNEVATALVFYTEEQDEKALVECVMKMFEAIKFVAPYASTVYGFVKPMVIPDPVMVELNRINEKLFDLDKKLDKIVNEIKEEFKVSEYNTYLNKMHNMQALYTRFIQMPNQVTLDALNKQGERNEMFEFINWLHREVIGQSLNPIIKFMKADEDYPKFIKWTQLILANYAQAMLLHGISVRFQPNVSEQIVNQTLGKDTAQFESNLREISDEFTKFIKYLTENYLRMVKQNVITKVNKSPKLDDQGMVDLLFDYISVKYPFREWFVCVVRCDFMIELKPETLYFEEDQGICLLECQKGDKRHAMSPKEYWDIQNATWSLEKLKYSDHRYLLITSTSTETSNYRDEVKNYLAGIDETKYCKNDNWLVKNSEQCTTIAKIVKDDMPKQYSSQIICIKLTDDQFRLKYSYKYSDQAPICFHQRNVSLLLGMYKYDMVMFTLKKDK